MQTLVRLDESTFQIIETTVPDNWIPATKRESVEFWGAVFGVAITAAAVFLLGAAWAYYCLGGPR
jgi:hypothetical protein